LEYFEVYWSYFEKLSYFMFLNQTFLFMDFFQKQIFR
jgi:hypothetical protein